MKDTKLLFDTLTPHSLPIPSHGVPWATQPGVLMTSYSKVSCYTAFEMVASLKADDPEFPPQNQLRTEGLEGLPFLYHLCGHWNLSGVFAAGLLTELPSQPFFILRRGLAKLPRMDSCLGLPRGWLWGGGS